MTDINTDSKMNRLVQSQPPSQLTANDDPYSDTLRRPMTRISRIFSRDPVQWFMFIAFILVGYVFYTTDFRDVLEDWFFDVRAKVSSHSKTFDDLMIIGIDDQAIEALDAAQTRVQYDGKRRAFLSIDAITDLTGLLANSDARLIALLLPNHAANHSDEHLRELTEIVHYDQRMFIGTTEYNRPFPGVNQIPYPLGSIRDRVFGYETFRRRSNMILRRLPFLGFRGLTEELMLPVALAYNTVGKFGDLSDNYLLNPVLPRQIPTVSAALAAHDPRKLLETVKGKIVIVGYMAFRDIPFQTTEMMNVNTPLLGDVQSVEKGIPLTLLVANAVENLIHQRQVQYLSPLYNLIQTVMIALLSGLLWELGSFTACSLSLIVWGSLIYGHAVMLSNLNTLIPLADTFIVSSFVMIFAAVRRLKDELKDMALRQVQTESKQEIAKIQSHFLTDFAAWLSHVTAVIISEIRTTQAVVPASLTNEDIYKRSYAAAEDFNEYLESIRQIPELESSAKRLAKTPVNLVDLCSRVSRRFAIKAGEKNIELTINAPDNLRPMLTNVNLLDAIVFNLISNAIKYSPRNSHIVINIQQSGKSETSIQIADQGPGIPGELKGRIFEKFYRIQDERLYSAKGTGLGLYLCRFFTTKLGGEIRVLSNQPTGSIFEVRFPS